MSNRSSILFIIGSLLLAIAIIASALLATKYIWAVHLVGCGEGAGCDWILKSQWSKIAGLPVAFLGLAYFSGLLILWLGSNRTGVFSAMSVIGRVGVLASVFFLMVMLIEGHFCIWCGIAHFANMLWWSVLEFRVRKEKRLASSTLRTLAPAVAVFILVLTATKLMQGREANMAQNEAQRKAVESIAKIGAPKQPIDSAPPESAGMPSPVKQTAQSPPRFGGRYWSAGEDKPVRLVVFQDYQCQLCFDIELEIRKMMSERTDFSLSVKQWPFDTECNKYLLTESPHPGACDVSRTAEAVGILGGEKAFWEIHHWLVDHVGQYSEAELVGKLVLLGIDTTAFFRVKASPAIDSLISADIEEGMALGLKFTPMVFVNGYEVQGWQSAGALPAAIDRAAEMAQSSPRPNDNPENAIDRLFAEWLKKPAVIFSLWENDNMRGTPALSDTVMVFGDLTCPYNAASESILQDAMKGRSNICYVFRDFPLDSSCNELVKAQINPYACDAARLASAAGRVGGTDAYWKMHQWVVGHRESFTLSQIEEAAAECGLSSPSLLAAMKSPQVANHLQMCLGLSKAMGIQMSPTIFINGKQLPDWRAPGLLKKVISHISEPVIR